jgi:hypothetical protein
MSGVRRVFSCLCLVLAVSAPMPCRADSGTSWPLKAQMQTTGTTGSSSGHMSTKKKTWIIVGCVLGAVAIGVAVSNHGGGGGSSSGGGGY